MAARFEDF